MDNKKLQKIWDEYAKTDPLWSILTVPEKRGNKWQIDEFFRTGAVEIDKVMEKIKYLGLDVVRKQALDFGCGVGRLTQALACYYEEVYGVDIAPTMINLAEKYNSHGNRCKYFLNDKNDLTLFKDKSFDLIYTNIVLQHMKPKYAKKYIKEFLRILSEQGILIFQIPSERIRSEEKYRKLLRTIFSTVLTDKLFYLNIYIKFIFNKEPRMDMYAIDKNEMVSFIEENGGKVVDIVKDQINHGNWESYIYYVLKI